MNSNLHNLLSEFKNAVSELQHGQLGVAEFSRQAVLVQPVLEALPSRYSEVFNHLLTRLESSALFTEESCSFSVSELHEQWRVWVEKAQSQLR